MPAGEALAGLRHWHPPGAEGAQPGQSPLVEADLVVYGGTSGGVTAAVRAARAGLSVVLAVFGDHVGGMTTGGLGLTDTGHPDSVGGLARAFYDQVARHYGSPAPRWDFEPHVAEGIHERWLADAGVEVRRRQHLDAITLTEGRIEELRADDGTRYRAPWFVDASYEGDLMAAAGVTYTTGREPATAYGETLAGVQPSTNHQFRFPVDPYRTPGDPTSGLLPGISPDPHGEPGEGDHRIQAYTFRLCVTTADDRLPFPRPDGYDPGRYELLRRHVEAGGYELYGRTCLVHSGPHGEVFDMNNHGAFSSDHIGANYDWPDAGHARREEIFQDHVRYQAGLLYFLANDPGLPAAVHEETRRFGLSPREFTDTAHWPPQLYIREARRMVAGYVITQADGTARASASDPVALASYVMDSHNAKRVVVDGAPRNEGNVQQSVTRPFGLSYRALVPRPGECENLLVAAAVSASHVAYASVRMEPVFMMLGEAAGAAAALAHAEGCPVQKVPYEALRHELLAGGAILDWPPPAAERP
ncbi:FAD-dependent oxidoreductase [Streptomyces sp. PT12]|uniref:FAD-dependent oxidoreductase n=1 Tax=Streptomyces sp. PT12 TaxID=1510197 RepID=UPI000DE4223E|nr:FAD-dependent oxidoreductase [Streptomyces sp. PT12]RBM18556.1 xanthan lyase [Streptomyces sp. PT12]